MESAIMNIEFIDTPIGTLEISASNLGLVKVSFSTFKKKTIGGNEVTRCCKKQLQEYFDGKRKQFNLPLDQHGTDFQKSVWSRLLEIPFGQSASYRDIAEMINNPKSVRAVGAANAKNPIGLIVPCHRVIGSNQALTGYAGGLERKAWLLEHEGIGFKVPRKTAQYDIENDLQKNLFDD
jgi:methylated-DNA-[protein]-cysteine S-methyltransferase